MTGQLVRRNSQTQPGGTVTYSVWVWSTVQARNVSASVSASGQAVKQAKFALCPSANGRTCAVGSLPAFQAVELLVTDQIETTALPGNQVTLTVNVQGTADASSSALSPAEATIATVVSQPTTSPAPIDTNPGIGTGVPPPTFPGLPGTTVTPGPISSLFPVVTPSATPSATATGQQPKKHKVTRVTATASSLPLDPRLIGGQVAGLAVLAAAITMVVARLSLRTPQLAAQSASVAGAPPVPEPKAPAPAEIPETPAAETAADKPE